MITKLDIVNHMLRTTGIQKVNTLETQDEDVVQTESALDSSNVDFQSKGWWFNKEYNLALVQNNSGEIILPQGYLEVIVSATSLQTMTPLNKSRYAPRGNKLYDSVAHSFNIGQTLYVDIVTQVAIEDMPAVASTYLKHLAAFDFFVDDEGDHIKAKELEKRMSKAWGFLQAAQLKAIATNALDSPFAAQLNHRIRQSGTATNPNWPGGRVV
jgi:hypothetical protein